MEAGLVFDRNGCTIHWHLPKDRRQGYLPDSQTLWEILWINRDILGGVAHTHPWDGPASPSGTDLTTFAAIEAGLGQNLVWPIVTFTDVVYLRRGSAELYTATPDCSLHRDQIQQLRDLSR